MKIALVANTGWYLYNFSLPLMRALAAAGHEVVAVAPEDAHSRKLIEAGFAHRHFPLEPTSINPIRELRSILALRRVLRAGLIDVVLSFTPKGNIYAAFALLGLPARLIVTISGLGRAYARHSMLRPLLNVLFRKALARAERVLFQNADDLRLFTSHGIVDPAKAERIPGSGVDLSRFAAKPLPPRAGGETVFLLAARMLWAKGVDHLVEAARALRAGNPAWRFQLLGPLDPPGPDAVPRQTLERWVREGAVEYLGETGDVRPYFKAADCVVLPSYYREGVPRSLLEAAAMAKPVVTTDMPGCRDAVEDGVTGFLCKPKNTGDLIAKLEAFIALDFDARRQMGEAARAKMEREFDETIVIGRYLDLIARSTL